MTGAHSSLRVGLAAAFGFAIMGGALMAVPPVTATDALLLADQSASQGIETVELVEATDGGSVAGAPVGECSLRAVGSDGFFTAGADRVGGRIVVVPHEITTLTGTGWTPHLDVHLVAERLGIGYVFFRFGAVADDRGAFLVRFDPDPFLTQFDPDPSRRGLWLFTATQAETPSDPWCETERVVQLLPLADVWNSKFLGDIKWLYLEGITTGCSGDRYCPDGRVTRGQVATFLARALNLPPTDTDFFTDDEGSVHEGNINRLRAAGITAGCGGTRFCPEGLVTRAQMATFVVRGFDLPSTSADYFTDDEGSVHEGNINRLIAAGVTHGCGGTNFCPNGAVTRGQMAAFLHRAM